MKNKLIFLIAIVFFALNFLGAENYKVINNSELNSRMKKVVPGDCIIMANGTWNDVQIEFKAKGTYKKHICLKAETSGKVLIEGVSNISISGNYLDVSGLVFTNGYTPTKTVILFKTSDKEYAYHCRVLNCVIDKFSKPFRETEDNWVAFWGKNNEVSNCYFGGKTNVGTTLIVCPNDSNSIHNKHLIAHNYFGPRPRLGSNGGETIRMGTSEVCLNSSETVVEGNYFDHCSGEVEIISNKSSDNKILNNTFFESEGSLVLRHGNRSTVAGNWFIGNGKPFTGGIRVINAGHKIYNNFLYKLTGDEFRSPLTIMNGIPDSPLSGYAPVKDVLIANNTFYDCKLPWNFCVGKSERNRIETPKSTRLINNIVYSPKEKELIISYDNTDGITLSNNLMISAKAVSTEKGSVVGEVTKANYQGKDFIFSIVKAEKIPLITADILGQSNANPVIGAFQNNEENTKTIVANSQNSGPNWNFKELVFIPKKVLTTKTIKVRPGIDNLYNAVNQANENDVLLLDSGTYFLTKMISFNKSLTIKASSKLKSKPVIKMEASNAGEPLFEIKSDVYLRIKGLSIVGKNSTISSEAAFKSADHALRYSLFIDNCDISGFNTRNSSIFTCTYCSMADSIVISNSILHNSYSGINLHKEKEDGKYNAETVIFKNSVFADLADYALDYYRGGNDESTVGGSLAINHCVFDSVGNADFESALKLSRIMYVKINNSIFSNTQAKGSFSLWYLYNKVSNSCFYNCPKPEFTKGADSKNLFYEKPDFENNSYLLSGNSTLIGKASDGKNIGLK